MHKRNKEIIVIIDKSSGKGRLKCLIFKYAPRKKNKIKDRKKLESAIQER